MIGEIIGLVVIGLIVGALGRLLHPGRDPIGIGLTILIGIGASLLVGLLIPGHGFLSFVLAVVVAALLVAAIAGGMRRRRRGFSY
jgi:uncharacterized membrane protein YeaQ/YmgE (transglycosylase-associated protein family)